MSKDKKKSKGTSLGTVVNSGAKFSTIVLIALRACNVIDWAWYWLLAPIFATWVLGMLIFAIAGIIAYQAVRKEAEE